MRKFTTALALILTLSFVSCDIEITGPTITNTNTNTNTNNNDFHDLINFAPAANPSAPVPDGSGGTETPLALPQTAQATATNYANANPTLVARSCQAVYGESAWAFMDGLVNTLRATEVGGNVRWGYMVKPTDGTISKDVIAYRATSDNTGAWGIDVIIDHCGNPTFGWGVLGFDPNAKWSGTRF